MHMRNTQYLSITKEPVFSYISQKMSGYVEGYDVGLKQVFGFNVS